MSGTSSTMYAYSSTRAKAMGSKLLDRAVISQLSKMDDVASMVGLLLQTSYKEYIDQFGGKDVRGELIDFALSKSLEVDVKKLIAIVPKEQKDMTSNIVGRSDAQNIKLVFYAKATGKTFEQISRYIIDSYNIDTETVKRAIEEQTIEGASERLAVRTPYGNIVREALNTYKKTSNLTEVNATIDLAFYKRLENAVKRLAEVSPESASVVRLDIEIRNILTLLRAKKHNLPVEKIKDILLQKGLTSKPALIEMYVSTKDIADLADRVKTFDLKHALDVYEKGKSKQMLIFEINMRNDLLKRAVGLLQHSTLSFATIMGYFYLKEMEVFALRIIINGKSYGLTKEEIGEMIYWQL
jgi:V/A-type H+/Na+-transporting ATPase subunit C